MKLFPVPWMPRSQQGSAHSMPPPHKQIHSSVLIVEDDDVSACLVEYLLQREGYRVATVYNAAQLKNMFTSMLAPELVIMGSQLHYAKPIELINTMHQQDKWAHIPVILLVNESHDDIDKLEQLLKSGVDDYILKPFGPGEILSLTRYFIGTACANIR